VIQMKHNFDVSSGVHDLEHSAAALKGAAGSAEDDAVIGNASQGSKLFSGRGH
jgi:hypothetical protein